MALLTQAGPHPGQELGAGVVFPDLEHVAQILVDARILCQELLTGLGGIEIHDLYNQFARIYASRFTMEELQQIVDFYSTETGQKLLSQNPGINRDLSNVLQLWENNARTEFLARVRASLRDQGHNV